MRVRTTTRGAADLRASLYDINGIITASLPDPDPATEALVKSILATLPRCQPLEHHSYVVRDVDADGIPTLDRGPVRTFKPAHSSRLRTEWKNGSGGPKALGARPAPMPEAETSLAPRPLPPADSLVAPGCTGPATFRHVAVTAAQVKPPYTVTLTGITPESGKADNTVPIGEKGIGGYRIEKTVKPKVDVRDREGNPPLHPVLLRLSVGCPRSGMLLVGAVGPQK